MRRIKMVGLAIVAVLAFAAVAAAGASAEEFIASKTGSLKGKALNTQKFNTGGFATVACKKLSVTGTVTVLKATEQAASIQYEECEVEGLGGSATISLADYTFFTGPPSVMTLNLIDITVSSPVKCKITVASGQSLSGLKYNNKTGKVEVEAKVTGIASEIVESGSSLFCGTVGEKNTKGTYTGNSEVELEGGTIEVK
ncbi:MAG: hypothetical protein WB698_11135 [Solirubrobacteraceae bacterium]